MMIHYVPYVSYCSIQAQHRFGYTGGDVRAGPGRLLLLR